ncbi:MAG: hypothetical protein FWD56_04660 [Bacteroidales bacterium]|nr:hypothetical protein [Bacteroidales bacterium]
MKQLLPITIILVYFILLALLMAAGMVCYKRSKPAKGLMIYLLFRVIKIILTVGFLFLYYLLVGKNTTAILLTVSVLYLLFLFVETSIFFRLGKKTGTDAPSN